MVSFYLINKSDEPILLQFEDAGSLLVKPGAGHFWIGPEYQSDALQDLVDEGVIEVWIVGVDMAADLPKTEVVKVNWGREGF